MSSLGLGGVEISRHGQLSSTSPVTEPSRLVVERSMQAERKKKPLLDMACIKMLRPFDDSLSMSFTAFRTLRLPPPRTPRCPRSIEGMDGMMIFACSFAEMSMW